MNYCNLTWLSDPNLYTAPCLLLIKTNCRMLFPVNTLWYTHTNTHIHSKAWKESVCVFKCQWRKLEECDMEILLEESNFRKPQRQGEKPKIKRKEKGEVCFQKCRAIKMVWTAWFLNRRVRDGRVEKWRKRNCDSEREMNENSHPSWHERSAWVNDP